MLFTPAQVTRVLFTAAQVTQLPFTAAQLTRVLFTAAQVARQQGEYIARILKDHPLVRPEREDEGPTHAMDAAPPFAYRHLGSLAYLGADR